MSNFDTVKNYYDNYYFDIDNYEKFSTIHKYGYYPLNDYYYLLLAKTLDEFLNEFGSIEQQFIDDFKRQSGYDDDDDGELLSNIKVLDAINNKILNSPTLTQENLITKDKNVIDFKESSGKEERLNMFNPIQYLIENPDVLIAANPLFANSANTETNLNIYILFSIYHLLTSPSGEHRSFLPKTVTSPDSTLFPTLGSDLDNFHITAEMKLPICKLACKMAETDFDVCTPEEKVLTVNLEHFQKETGKSLFIKLRISVFEMDSGISTYYLTMLVGTPGGSESSIELYSTFSDPNSNFLEALYCNKDDIVFHCTKGTGHNTILNGGYARVEIPIRSPITKVELTDISEGVLKVFLYRTSLRKVEVNTFISKFIAAGLISQLDETVQDPVDKNCDLGFNLNSCLCVQPVSEVINTCSIDDFI